MSVYYKVWTGNSFAPVTDKRTVAKYFFTICTAALLSLSEGLSVTLTPQEKQSCTVLWVVELNTHLKPLPSQHSAYSSCRQDTSYFPHRRHLLLQLSLWVSTLLVTYLNLLLHQAWCLLLWRMLLLLPHSSVTLRLSSVICWAPHLLSAEQQHCAEHSARTPDSLLCRQHFGWCIATDEGGSYAFKVMTP